MVRQARKISSTGIYHIIQRGVNRQVIFHEEEDFERFISTLLRFKLECNLEIMGYCLMSNHIHLLVRDNLELSAVSAFIKKVSSSYVYWYNMKYERTGHLFEERFKSEVVEDERYLLTVIRYIHQNPVKAGLVGQIMDYKWSSYKSYLVHSSFIDSKLVLSILSSDIAGSLKEYVRYMNIEGFDECLEMDTRVRVKDQRLYDIIIENYPDGICIDVSPLDMEAYFVNLKRIMSCYRVSIRQLSRVLGLPHSVCNYFWNAAIGNSDDGRVDKEPVPM